MATHSLTNNGTTRQGVFWHVGTNGGVDTFANPVPTSIPYTQDAYYGSGYDGNKLSNRTADAYISQAYSYPPTAYVRWDLGEGKSLKVSGVAIQQNNEHAGWAGYCWRNILIQGSNDDTNWTTIANPTTSTTQTQWDDLSWTETTTAYRYLRIKQNGQSANYSEYYLSAAEVDWFGTYDDGIAPPPEITDIDPATGEISGGTEVVITGSNFTDATVVTFGGEDAASYTVDSDTQITAETPAYATAEAVDVVVTTPGGTDTLTDGFTYFDPVPTITDVTPAEGDYEGGIEVVITGENFTGATSVTVGTEVESFTVDSDTQITAVIEWGMGLVDVTVTTPTGTGTLPDGFEYVNPAATGWTLTQNSVTVPLPVDAEAEPEITHTRDQATYQPLGRYGAIFDLGQAHGATVKTQLFFLTRAEELTIRTMAMNGLCTLTSPYGDSWLVIFDGTWTQKIKNAFSAQQEAVRTVEVTWIEV